MTPEEKARVKIDKQLNNAGWDIVSRDEYIPMSTTAVKEALMQGNTESDYLLFIDNKAVAVLEAKREENNLGDDVADQAEGYATHPQNWYGLWFDKLIPLVYMANAKYYANSLHQQYDSYTIHSGNLYQIFTYVKNKEAELSEQEHEQVAGMLLYAKTDAEVFPKNEYRMSGNTIEVRTLDLSGDFDSIKMQLNHIANKYLKVA